MQDTKLFNRAVQNTTHFPSGAQLYKVKNSTNSFFTCFQDGSIEFHKMNSHQWHEHMDWLYKI